MMDEREKLMKLWGEGSSLEGDGAVAAHEHVHGASPTARDPRRPAPEAGPEEAPPPSKCASESDAALVARLRDSAPNFNDLVLAPPDALEITDPQTGEVLDTVDKLLEAHQRWEGVAKMAYATKQLIASELGARAPGDSRTRRLRGEQYRARLEFPDPVDDQAKLRKVLAKWPDLARTYLTYTGLRPVAKEVKKLEKETGPPRFEEFKAALLAAKKPSTAAPKVVIEEDAAGELPAMGEMRIVSVEEEDGNG